MGHAEPIRYAQSAMLPYAPDLMFDLSNLVWSCF